MARLNASLILLVLIGCTYLQSAESTYGFFRKVHEVKCSLFCTNLYSWSFIRNSLCPKLCPHMFIRRTKTRPRTTTTTTTTPEPTTTTTTTTTTTPRPTRRWITRKPRTRKTTIRTTLEPSTTTTTTTTPKPTRMAPTTRASIKPTTDINSYEDFYGELETQ